MATANSDNDKALLELALAEAEALRDALEALHGRKLSGYNQLREVVSGLVNRPGEERPQPEVWKAQGGSVVFALLANSGKASAVAKVLVLTLEAMVEGRPVSDVVEELRRMLPR